MGGALKWAWRVRSVLFGVLIVVIGAGVILWQAAGRTVRLQAEAEILAWRTEAALSTGGNMGRARYFDVPDITKQSTLDREYAAVDQIETMALQGDLLVLGTTEGLVAINTETLQEKWMAKIGSVSVSPLLSNQSVYATVLPQRGGESYLFKLDRVTGEEVWKTKLGRHTQIDPLLVGGHVVINDGLGELVALDSRTGLETWRTKSETGVFTALAKVGDHILVGTTEEIWILSIERGEVLRERQVKMDAKSTPVMSGKYIYLASSDGTVYAFDAELRKQLWKQRVGAYGELTMTKNYAVLVDRDGSRLTGLDLKTGKIVWDNTTFDAGKEDHYGGVIGSHGQFYLATQAGGVSAYSAKSGKLVWEKSANEQPLVAITLGTSELYAATRSGRVFVFGEGVEKPL